MDSPRFLAPSRDNLSDDFSFSAASVSDKKAAVSHTQLSEEEFERITSDVAIFHQSIIILIALCISLSLILYPQHNS